MTRKVVIAGGGIAGSCAGVYAQACGYEVEVIEQPMVPGGLATSYKWDGYTFETCLHWLVGSKAPEERKLRGEMCYCEKAPYAFITP